MIRTILEGTGVSTPSSWCANSANPRTAMPLTLLSTLPAIPPRSTIAALKDSIATSTLQQGEPDAERDQTEYAAGPDEGEVSDKASERKLVQIK